jgi:hypothetical protein
VECHYIIVIMLIVCMLSDVMRSVIILIVIKVIVPMLSIIIWSVVMLNAIILIVSMLSVIFAECRYMEYVIIFNFHWHCKFVTM